MKATLALASILALSSGAFAGNIALTGHDDDFHAGGSTGSQAADQFAAMLNFVRSGAPNSTLPVLVFDHGSELTSLLTALGVSFTNVDPDAGVPSTSLFDVTKFSALAVASDESCGGCDNTSTSISDITAVSASIASFFNAGGGIVALAGADNAATYYGFLPASASGFGNPPSTGYVQTSFGASLGIPAVNGNATHNFFAEPGTGGVSSAYGVVERLGDASTGTAETIACRGCSISGGGIVGGGGEVPEPASAALFGLGLAAVAALRARRARA